VKKRKPKGYTLDAGGASFAITTTPLRASTEYRLGPADDTPSRRAAALQRVERQRERSESTKLRKREDKLAAVRAFKDALPPHVNPARAIRDAFHVKSLSTVYRWFKQLP
jgi:hypothetical protein